LQTENGSLTLNSTEIDDVANCVELIGTTDFPARFSLLCMTLCHADTVYSSAFFQDDIPATLYTNYTDEESTEILKVYTKVAYVLDPFYIRFKRGLEDEVLELGDFAPDGFTDSEYFKMFYSALGLESECGLLVCIDDLAALFFSFGTLDSSRELQTGRLLSAMPILASMARRHWPTLRPDRIEGFGRRAAFLEQAFQNFGSSVLSPREADIARLIMKGYSTKALAQVFGNSPETIKVHRRRLYAKLKIESQGELLGLFIESLATTPATSTGDPLEYYWKTANQE
jgi:DNA-binding CsgD family transcriptional regulator